LGGFSASDFAKPLWAVVEATGSAATVVNDNDHTTGASRLGNGLFSVTFDQNVGSCAFLATIGSTANTTDAPPRFATVEPGPTDPKELRLRSWDADGNLSDPGSGNTGFHVVVFC
jgi:hypothetical protein